jgi:hypothetical protein
LASLFKKAIQLRTVSIMIEPPDRRTPNLIQEEVDLMLWFSNQFDETRSLFAPYLRLDPRPTPKEMPVAVPSVCVAVQPPRASSYETEIEGAIGS